MSRYLIFLLPRIRVGLFFVNKGARDGWFGRSWVLFFLFLAARIPDPLFHRYVCIPPGPFAGQSGAKRLATNVNRSRYGQVLASRKRTRRVLRTITAPILISLRRMV